jgi:SAM-dependent methyltransferase
LCPNCGTEYPPGEVPVLIPAGAIDWAQEANASRYAANAYYQERLDRNDGWWVDRSEYNAAMRRHDWRAYRSPIVEYIARRYREPVVVDAGGGDGWFMKRCEEGIPGVRGVVIDLSDVVVASGMQQNRFRGVVGISGAIDHLPLRSRSVDCVIAIEVMEHVRQPADAFASVCRVLKPGGSFILTTPNPLSYALWFEEGRTKGLLAGVGATLTGRVPTKQREIREVDGVLERYLTPAQIVRLARAAGFGRVSHRSVGIGLAPMPYYRAENRRWPLPLVRGYERLASRVERALVCPAWLPWGRVQRVTCVK